MRRDIAVCPGLSGSQIPAVSRRVPVGVRETAEIRAFPFAGTSRDKPGHAIRVSPEGTGTTGTRALRRVPMSRPRGHRPRTSGRSLNQNAGPSHRGAVGGTLSRSISIWGIK